jgi:DNA repair protein RadC
MIAPEPLPDSTPFPSPVPDAPRERALEEGIGSLGDAELLAVLLGTGLAGRPVALVSAGLLERAGGLAGLARLSPAAIAEHPGLGLAKALRIRAALELGRRAVTRASAPRPDLRDSRTVAEYLAPRLGVLDHEEVWVLCLDGRNNLRGVRRLAQGGSHTATIGPRDVMRIALSEAATAVILAHNHPSGDALPSEHDLLLTGQVRAAGAVVGIPLVDHLIVTPSGKYCSLLDMGALSAL